MEHLGQVAQGWMFCTSLAEASALHSRVKKDSSISPLDLTHESSLGGRQKKKLETPLITDSFIIVVFYTVCI